MLCHLRQIPSIAVVFGTCIAGGAYFAGMCDYIVMVKGNAQLALAGKKLTEVCMWPNKCLRVEVPNFFYFN